MSYKDYLVIHIKIPHHLTASITWLIFFLTSYLLNDKILYFKIIMYIHIKIENLRNLILIIKTSLAN